MLSSGWLWLKLLLINNIVAQVFHTNFLAQQIVQKQIKRNYAQHTCENLSKATKTIL